MRLTRLSKERLIRVRDSILFFEREWISLRRIIRLLAGFCGLSSNSEEFERRSGINN